MVDKARSIGIGGSVLKGEWRRCADGRGREKERERELLVVEQGPFDEVGDGVA